MNRFKPFIIVFIGSLLFLSSCGIKDLFVSDDEHQEDQQMDDDLDNDTKDINLEEMEEDEVEDQEEIKPFAEEVRILEVESLFYDEEEVDINLEGLLIEHEKVKYVEYETVSELLDYEIKLDVEQAFAEILEGKEDFTYEATNEEEGGALLEVGELYIDSMEDYINPGYEETFDFVEYNERLYIPKRVLEVGFHTPFNYIRKDRVLELGKRAEPIYLDDIETRGSMKSGDGGISSDAKYATIQGERYEVVAFSHESLSKQTLIIETDYQHSYIEGIFYNDSDEELEFVVLTEEDKELLRQEVKANQVQSYEVDVTGTEEVKIEVDQLSQSVFLDRYDFAIYSEIY